MTIVNQDLSILPVTALERHPQNRPLGLNTEKIDQLKESIRQYGFFSSEPLSVCRLNNNGHYRIIKGEHRWEAAKQLGMTDVPCTIQEWTEEEQLIQLIIGNVQTENHELDFGNIANELVSLYERKGLSGKMTNRECAKRLSLNNEQSLSQYRKAFYVYAYLKLNVKTGFNIISDSTKLYEISKLPDTHWLWLHDFIITNDLSKQQVIEVVKAIREFDAELVASADAAALIDVTPEQIASDILQGDRRRLSDTVAFLTRLRETLSKWEQRETTLYSLNEKTGEIIEEAFLIHDTFLQWVAAEKKRTLNAINQVYKRMVERLQAHTYEEAKRQYDRYHDAEMARIRKETQQTIIHDWIELTPLAEIAESVNQSPSDAQRVIDDYRLEHGLTHLDAVHGDFQTVCQTLASDSIDVILTDPPYPQEFLPLYEALADTAARVLKPGGSCVVMCGQSYLPDILAMMTKHLRYHWMLAYLTPGGQAVQLWDRNVNTFWKPMLWFVKGTYAGKWIGDVAKSAVNDNDKRFHGWGQSESGMLDLVERCSEPGDLILDPFCGAGTTGVACRVAKRGFLGIDCDREHVIQTRRRIYGV